MKRSRRREKREKKWKSERERRCFTENTQRGINKRVQTTYGIYTRIYKTTKMSNVVNVLLYKNIVQKVIVTDTSDSQSASSVVPRYFVTPWHLLLISETLNNTRILDLPLDFENFITLTPTPRGRKIPIVRVEKSSKSSTEAVVSNSFFSLS